ncbi:MAG: AraC family transcriptional regulator ligand-binding domain-containing protein [Pseudomonadales bacterium]|nr:AraC family transcriptional regulator ligand-binding domain-containing protein [Pseudomonadales bacterium]MCP5202850.1 AraC family transcriptional regulator ligand-binding domain-containing protein [Pseudomonadales bacterium]
MSGQILTRSESVLLPYYPRLVYLWLIELGHSEDELFQGLDFTASHLQEEKYRLSIEQHERFILRALEVSNDPHLAVRLVGMYDPSKANLALMAVANSGKISRALEMITRYQTLFTRVFSIRFVQSGDGPAMELESQLEHKSVIYFSISAFVLMLDNFFQEVLDGAHLIKCVALGFPEPAGFDKVRDEFGFPLVFDRPTTRIHFDSAFLDQPLNQSDPQTVRLLLEISERQLQEAEAEMSFVGAVKAFLIDHIASPPTLDEAARLLAVSPRGLRRKLAEAGTSYQKLLDSVRLKMALRLLKETDTPVSSIGYELGFDNPSDFGRAFKRWSGQSPSSLRHARP